MIEIKRAILKMILRKNMITISEYTKVLKILESAYKAYITLFRGNMVVGL